MQLFGSEFQVPYGDVGAITFMAHIKRRQQHEHGYARRALRPHRRHLAQARAAQPRRADAEADDARRLPALALGGRAAAPVRLLPEHRRRRRLHRHLARARARSRQAPGAHPRRRPVALARRSSIRPAAIAERIGGSEGRRAWPSRMAGVTPRGHRRARSSTTPSRRASMHDLVAYGFCAPDEVGDFIAAGNLEFGGTLPCNTAGGLISEGHLSGFGHVREAVRQLRGECRRAPGGGRRALPGHRLRRRPARGAADGQLQRLALAVSLQHGVRSQHDDRESWSRTCGIGESDVRIEKPLPRPTEDSAPFWEAAAKASCACSGAATAGTCAFRRRSSARAACRSRREWVQLSGRGTVYSWIVVHQSQHPAFNADAPYNVAIVELEEGPRLHSNMVDCANERDPHRHAGRGRVRQGQRRHGAGEVPCLRSVTRMTGERRAMQAPAGLRE